MYNPNKADRKKWLYLTLIIILVVQFLVACGVKVDSEQLKLVTVSPATPLQGETPTTSANTSLAPTVTNSEQVMPTINLPTSTAVGTVNSSSLVADTSNSVPAITPATNAATESAVTITTPVSGNEAQIPETTQEPDENLTTAPDDENNDHAASPVVTIAPTVAITITPSLPTVTPTTNVTASPTVPPKPVSTENEGRTDADTSMPLPEPTSTLQPVPTNIPLPESTNTLLPKPSATLQPNSINTSGSGINTTPSTKPTNTPSPKPTYTPKPEPTNTPLPKPTGTPQPAKTTLVAARPTTISVASTSTVTNTVKPVAPKPTTVMPTITRSTPPILLPDSFAGKWFMVSSVLILNKETSNYYSGSLQFYGDTKSYRVFATADATNLVGNYTDGKYSAPFKLSLSKDSNQVAGVVEKNNTKWCGVRSGPLPNGCGWSGTWSTSFVGRSTSTLKLVQTGGSVKGDYLQLSTIQATVKANKLEGTFKNGNQQYKFTWSIQGVLSNQFFGFVTLPHLSPDAWCGWKEGATKPSPCDGRYNL